MLLFEVVKESFSKWCSWDRIEASRTNPRNWAAMTRDRRLLNMYWRALARARR